MLDENEYTVDAGEFAFVDARVARNLERKLAELKEINKQMREALTLVKISGKKTMSAIVWAGSRSGPSRER